MSGVGTLDHVRRMTRASLAIAGIALASIDAGAEPRLSPLAPKSAPQFAAEEGANSDLFPLTAVTPLRLTLVFHVFPAARQVPSCPSLEEPSGNTLNGVPIQRYDFLPLAPRLVLHGVSSAGCPVDAGAGGGLTYALPLVNDTWLVPSTGFYSVRRPGMPPITVGAARVDVVKTSEDGGSLSVGVGIKYGTPELTDALALGGRF